MLAVLLPLFAFLHLLPGQAAPPAQVAPAFAYTALKPVNGHLAGVMELGANGLNAFVVLLDK